MEVFWCIVFGIPLGFIVASLLAIVIQFLLIGIVVLLVKLSLYFGGNKCQKS